MKKLSTILLPTLIFSTFIFISCKKDDYEKLVKETAIKTEFARNSPVTDDITLKLLEKSNKWGNFLMTANLKGQLQDPYLAYEVDGQKIVLRDDGKGADSLKGDGIFSVYVNIDTNEVRDMVAQQNASITRSSKLETDQRELVSLLRFDKRDTARFTAFHTLLQSDPNFTFENRQVKFNKRDAAMIDIDMALRLRIPIHIFFPFFCPPPPPDLIPKSLMINSLGVVEDISRTWNPVTNAGAKTGAWTFNNIINQMVNKSATGKTATEFVLTWLKTWGISIPLNGDVAGARPAINTLISNWQNRSMLNGLPPDTLDMAEAPFKLLAIVNRVDLRQNVGYSSSNAGEGRFVFGLLRSTATDVLNSPESFTIIFEFGINRSGCKPVRNWGEQWYNLHTLTPGDPVYNKALQDITDQFVNANTNPAKPNGSSLNQIRTDEIALTGPWQLREFNIDSVTHLLKLVTVKQTPRNALNHSALLATFINTNCAGILANNYVVTEAVTGLPFLGAVSNNLNGPADAWNATITCVDPAKARRIFSLNTCNACHGIETATGFTHVNVASFGSIAGLSGFLTGITVTDPVSGTPVTFSDLDDRAKGLQNLVCMSCKIFGPLIFRPTTMVH